MGYLPDVYTGFEAEFPEISKAYHELASVCHEWGPLDEKTRRLVKLGTAIGLCTQGAVRSHARRALEEGVSPEEVRHTVLLSLSTIGFPLMIAALRWVDEVIAASESGQEI